MRIIQPLAILTFVCITILPIELLGQKIPTDFIRIRNRSKPDSYIHIKRSPKNRSINYFKRKLECHVGFKTSRRRHPFSDTKP